MRMIFMFTLFLLSGLLLGKPTPGPNHHKEVHNFEFLKKENTGTFILKGVYAESLYHSMTDIRPDYYATDINDQTFEKVGKHLRCQQRDVPDLYQIEFFCDFKMQNLSSGILAKAQTNSGHYESNRSGRLEINLLGEVHLKSNIAYLLFENLSKKTITEVKTFGGYDPSDPLEDNGPVKLVRITKVGKNIKCIKIHRPAKPSVFTEKIDCYLNFKKLETGTFR